MSQSTPSLPIPYYPIARNVGRTVHSWVFCRCFYRRFKRRVCLVLLTSGFVVCFYGCGKPSLLVKDVLDQAERNANNVLYNAEMVSNRVLTDGALKAKVTIENVRYAMEDKLNEAYNRISNDEKNVVDAADRLREDANKNVDKVIGAGTDLDINLNRTLHDLPLLEKAPLSIARVRGIYQVYQEIPYPVLIKGNGFGARGLSDNVKVEFSVNGRSISDDLILPSGENETQISIPQEYLNEHFQSTVNGKAEMSIKISRPKHTFFSNKPEVHIFRIPFVLFPRASAYLHLTAYVTEPVWDENLEERTYEWPAGGNGSTSFVQFRQTISFDDRTRVNSLKLGIDTSPMCQHCAAFDGSGIAQNPEKTYEIHYFDHTLTFKAACNGDPCNLRWTVYYQRLVPRTRVVNFPDEKTVAFSEPFDFDLPPNTRDWSVDGRFYTGQQINCKKGNSGAFIDEIGITNVGDHDRITLKLRSPFQLRAPTPEDN